MSSRIDHRIVVWPVVSAPSATRLCSRPPRNTRGAEASTRPITAMATIEMIAARLLSTPRKIAMARIGKSSPAAPEARK